MLTITSAPAARCTAVGPTANQMSSQMFTPTGRAGDGEDRALRPGLEVALFVEHPVVRQVYLVVPAHQLAVVQDRRRVIDVGVSVSEPDHHGNVTGGRRHLPQLPDVLLDELRLEQQVLGGIPGYGELRKRDEIGPRVPRAVYVLDDPAGIAVQVADRGIGLGQGNSECTHGVSASPSYRRRPVSSSRSP